MSTGSEIAPSRYIFETEDVPAEIRRLRLLEQRYDEASFRRLAELGDLIGRRALEVGAGTGSVACWLGRAVGPHGSVVAIDIDLRFLEGAASHNVTVRHHDIVRDPLEPLSFDIVHCRALLLHLNEPARALGTMVAALRPDGQILVEDADAVTMVAADPAHPASPAFDRVMTALFTSVPTGDHNPSFARGLLALARRAGLVDCRHEATAALRFGDSAAAEFVRRSSERFLPALRRTSLDPADLAPWRSALADPSFSFYDMLSVAVWARKPA